MTIHEQLAREIDTLPAELVEEVLDFIEFVRVRASRRGRRQRLNAQVIENKDDAALDEILKDDPIVGMFSGSPHLATDAEKILEEGFGRDT